jgi:uncharacterized membrane protein
MEKQINKRIESIDILRGIVMVIMALDHVRDYFHFSANNANPMDLATTTPLLYFTRWITHFCAPIFIFLSGTSIYLQSLRKTKFELSRFLITRGLWLILLEIVVNTFGWSFNPSFPAFFMQVIWAIGISMVLMGVFIFLPYLLILTLGLTIVFGHNTLDYFEQQPDFKSSLLWDIMHHGVFKTFEIIKGHSILIIYPFLPWTGLMMLGYCLGKLYTNEYSEKIRLRNLKIKGISLILFFIVLRATNLYGNPSDWTTQKTWFYSALSFLDVEKYPPSLLYLCMTIGPALLGLAWLENIKSKWKAGFIVFGRVALFYYVLHIYLIHFLCMLIFFANGHTMADAVSPESHIPFYFVIMGEGFSLTGVYLIWLVVLAILYPFCKKYDAYKTKHKEKKWLSYF